MQRHILSHSHILTVRIPKHLADHTAPPSLDSPDLARRVIRQSPSHFLGLTQGRIARVQDAETNALLLPEVSFDGDDADGEEVRFVAEGGVGASVDVDCAVRGEAVKEPEVAVADGRGGGEEAGVQRGKSRFFEGGGSVGGAYYGDYVDGVF